MSRLQVLGLVALVFLLGHFSVQAQEVDLKALFKKAIEAHGGDQFLAKKAATAKFKGTIVLMGATIDMTGETSIQKPDKLRNTMTIEIQGKKIEIITVFNGQKMWVSAGGETKEINDDKILKEVRESMLVEGAGGLTEFIKEPYTLSSVGEVKVKDADAIGVRVSKKGQRDLNLFFDKKTNLVVKTEMRSYDYMSGQEVTQEKFITSYQERGGLKVPKTMEILKDGKAFITMEITEAEALDRLDDSVFAKP
jgi:outer membrane lipoprotein-sorting protein